MPVVTIDIVRNSFTPAQKQEIVARVTDALVAVEGEAMRPLTWVRINELAPGDNAIGGQPLDIDALCRFTAMADEKLIEMPSAMRRATVETLLATISDFAAAAKAEGSAVLSEKTSEN